MSKNAVGVKKNVSAVFCCPLWQETMFLGVVMSGRKLVMTPR